MDVEESKNKRSINDAFCGISHISSQSRQRNFETPKINFKQNRIGFHLNLSPMLFPIISNVCCSSFRFKKCMVAPHAPVSKIQNVSDKKVELSGQAHWVTSQQSSPFVPVWPCHPHHSVIPLFTSNQPLRAGPQLILSSRFPADTSIQETIEIFDKVPLVSTPTAPMHDLELDEDTPFAVISLPTMVRIAISCCFACFFVLPVNTPFLEISWWILLKKH